MKSILMPGSCPIVLIAALFSIFVSSCEKEDSGNNAASSAAKTRVYYIAAEEVIWDYAPLGMNVFTGMPFDATDSVYAC